MSRRTTSGTPLFSRFAPGHPFLSTPPVWHPDAPRDSFSVVLFRRKFAVSEMVKPLRLRITASQRYELFIDGALLSRGPSRSDPLRWGVREVAIGPLAGGDHVLAVRAFHFGADSGIGQMGCSAFLIVQADPVDGIGEKLDSSSSWRCARDLSRAPIAEHAWYGQGSYYVVGAGERIDAARMHRGWRELGFDDSSWVPANKVASSAEDPWGNLHLGHDFQPDPLPPMEENDARFSRVARCPEGMSERVTAMLRHDNPFTVEPNSTAVIALDFGVLTNAYPLLRVSRGAGSSITMVSAEGPYLPGCKQKGNRDEVEGKQFRGHKDIFLPDGGAGREFRTLHFRSFRYVELSIATAGEPMVIESFTCTTTGFPLRVTSRFTPDRARKATFGAISEISERTIRLCAHETFFDCPHYEQAQFPGDTRIQAIYHYLVCNEDRLARKAIGDFLASRTPYGLTQCRFPSRRLQILPTFSLYWIGMIHDFLVYRGDVGLVTQCMPFACEVMNWFLGHRRADGMLGLIEYAPFVDWTHAFTNGNAPQDHDGGSATLTLLVAMACRWLARIERISGNAPSARHWDRTRRELIAATLHTCWDPKRRVLRDTVRGTGFSQHTHAHAVLAGAWKLDVAKSILRRVLDDPAATRPGSNYFRYYVMQACKECGMGEFLYSLLPAWERLLEGTGLTTWPETDSVLSRSDCHAWSVTPSIEFVETILGVRPDPSVAGYRRAVLGPCPGDLDKAEGSIRVPAGKISVRWRRTTKKTLELAVTSPVEIVTGSSPKVLAPGTHVLKYGC